MVTPILKEQHVIKFCAQVVMTSMETFKVLKHDLNRKVSRSFTFDWHWGFTDGWDQYKDSPPARRPSQHGCYITAVKHAVRTGRRKSFDDITSEIGLNHGTEYDWKWTNYTCDVIQDCYLLKASRDCASEKVSLVDGTATDKISLTRSLLLTYFAEHKNRVWKTWQSVQMICVWQMGRETQKVIQARGYFFTYIHRQSLKF